MKNVLKSRFTMKKNGKSFYDNIARRVVYHWTDCYGFEYMAFGRFGFRVKV
jgi:hypothetical protein